MCATCARVAGGGLAVKLESEWTRHSGMRASIGSESGGGCVRLIRENSVVRSSMSTEKSDTGW